MTRPEEAEVVEVVEEADAADGASRFDIPGQAMRILLKDRAEA